MQKNGGIDMQSFLMALVECSVAMSVLILPFIAVTPLLESRFAAKWRYYAWLALVIGLIIPFRPHLDRALIQVSTPASPLITTQSSSINTANANTAKTRANIPWPELAGGGDRSSCRAQLEASPFCGDGEPVE
jgi:beta-lactamase regulating signal transducer with metallopeptidase domain